jgi:hypothetical protein
MSLVTPAEDYLFSTMDCVELEYEDYRSISDLDEENKAELLESLSEEYCVHVPDEASGWSISQLAQWLRGQL